MINMGYALSSEEQQPWDLVRWAAAGEEAGFEFALISDHFHPWMDAQGQSAFVWSVIGAIAQATKDLRLGTGVTCPTMRIHPAIVAHAAATSACLMDGRFFLGVGSGENLNEHVTGRAWPAADMRLAMLRESIGIIRELWSGEEVTHRGEHFVVDHARLYSLPKAPPALIVAAGGEEAATLAGEYADGLISTAPKDDLIDAFVRAGGSGPRYAQMTVCWADNDAAARRIALERWPNAALAPDLKTELALPRFFASAAREVTEEQIARRVICGPDPEPYVKKIEAFVAAGFDHLCFHQVGDDQAGFLRFATKELLPLCAKLASADSQKSKAS